MRQQETPVNEQAHKEGLYLRLAGIMLSNPAVTRGTMIGFPCLRYQGRLTLKPSN